MNRSTLLAVLGFAGAGAVYYVMANRDTTPVGLTTQFLGGEGIGEDEEGNSYKIDLVLGTFRESESSLIHRFRRRITPTSHRLSKRSPY